MQDVVVVGAGPAGLTTAQLIASKGFKTLVLEEHPQIGKPCQCAGLVSWRLQELLPDMPEKIVLNRIYKARFFSPSASCFTLCSSKPFLVIDRQGLDRWLATKARKAGAEIRNERFEDLSIEDYIHLRTNKGFYRAKLLIGADGASSTVAKRAGIKRNCKIFQGLQITCEKSSDPKAVELWFSGELEYFGWVIPESARKARLGILTDDKPQRHFRKFLRKRIGRYKKPNVTGIIMPSLIQSAVACRIMLVGDSACQSKPHSGGGIVYGLKASRCCAAIALKALQKNNCSANFLQLYDRLWKSKLAMPIRKGLLLKRINSLLGSCQLDLLFSVLSNFQPVLEQLDPDFL